MLAVDVQFRTPTFAENSMIIFALLLVIATHLVAHGGARFLSARLFGVRNWVVRRFITLTGPLANYAIAVVLVFAGYLIAGREYWDEASMEVDVGPGGPADQAGMRSGDRILMIGDEQPENWDAMKRILSTHAGEPVDITIERAEREMHLAVTPGAPGTPNEGKILVGPPFKAERVGFLRAAKLGLLEPLKTPARALIAIARKLRGRAMTELYGPVGIVRVERTSTGFGDVLKLMGSLSGFLLPIFGLVVLVPPRRNG
jgi:regulator of sigma E protease